MSKNILKKKLIIGRRANKKVFFIGIGGAGMSNLAFLAKDIGFDVCGSDIKESRNINRLKKKKIKVFIGHSENNIKKTNPDYVVYSSAIPEDNEELKLAKNKNLPLLHRFSFLTKIIAPYKKIAVAGTHGKTTTTSMIGFILQNAKKPAYVYWGGEDISLKNKKITPQSWIVSETDESDKSFLLIDPQVAVITNVDRDHLSNYENSFKQLKNAFSLFIKGGKFRKYNIICADDKNLNEITKNINSPKKILTYGFDKKADLKATNTQYSQKGATGEIFLKERKQGVLNLPSYGEKNLLNALAAILACYFAGVKIKKSIEILKKYSLPKRRCEKIGEKNNILVFDDKALHPAQIKAVLKSLKIFKRKIIAVYQPHRYTRMAMLGEEIGKAFKDADFIISTDIYSAFEKPIRGINGKKVFSWVKKHNPGKKLFYLKDYKKTPMFIKSKARPGDLIITLGLGTIKEIPLEILKIISP